MRSFYQLENPVQSYAWGSLDGISDYIGIPNIEGKPMAELWMGAHPANPSFALDGTTRISLDRLIGKDPVAFLGKDALRRFGGELPYLFKVLSASGPLSLQVHPPREQARIGFDRENREGKPLADPARDYKDPNPKREILMALSPFTAMCGFRDPAESLRLLGSVSCPALDAEMRALTTPDGRRSGYVSLYRSLLELENDSRREIISTATKTAHIRSRETADIDDRNAYELLLALVDRFPDDIGILCPLYLNIVNLVPGEALFIPSGIIHSYVRGTGLELMTNSDNTLRCGLTPKHRNVPELYSILEDAPFAPEIARPDHEAKIFRYPARFPEFELDVLNGNDERNFLRAGRPAILLGLAGELTVSANGDARTIAKGTSLFVPASVDSIEIAGTGKAALATIPEEFVDGNMD
jgi:mannose-6-phosphate isomerase